METFPKWMEDDYRKIANKGPLSTLILDTDLNQIRLYMNI